MSTVTTNPAIELPAFADDTSAAHLRQLGDEEAGWGGLPKSAWVKIGVLTVLMALLFHFNLARLWLKTNPFYGQANWAHAIFVPLIGLFYLYVHRRDLVDPPAAPAFNATLTSAWGVMQLVAIAAVLCFAAAFPGAVELLAAGLGRAGLLVQYHGWPLTPVWLLLAFAVGSAVALFVAGRRAGRGRAASQWASRVWPNLGAWFMLALVGWGTGFFASALSGALFLGVRIVLSILSLALLAVVVWDRAPIGAPRGAAAPQPAPDSRRRLFDHVRLASSGWFGGFILAWGILFSVYGIWPGQNDFFKDIGMIATLFGLVLLLCGWGVMRTAWFPILFLFCAIPWPDQVYSWVAGPLQHLAAAVAVRVLTLFNVPSSVSGTKIIMTTTLGQPDRMLNVEEACAGLRSLMTFISLAAGGAFVFLSSRPLWHRLIIVASAVPIAVACNVFRVSGSGLLDHFVSRGWSEGFAHQFVGLAMLVPAFFLILLVAVLLDNLFIEVDESNAVSAGARAGKAAGAKALVLTRPSAGSARTTTAPARAVAVPARAAAAPARAAAAPARAAAAPARAAAAPARGSAAPAQSPPAPLRGGSSAPAKPAPAGPTHPGASASPAPRTTSPAKIARPTGAVAPAKSATQPPRPVAPASKPAAAAPAQSAKPATPTGQPAPSAAQPARSMAQPARSATQPARSVAQPATGPSVARPPAARPPRPPAGD